MGKKSVSEMPCMAFGSVDSFQHQHVLTKNNTFIPAPALLPENLPRPKRKYLGLSNVCTLFDFVRPSLWTGPPQNGRKGALLSANEQPSERERERERKGEKGRQAPWKGHRRPRFGHQLCEVLELETESLHLSAVSWSSPNQQLEHVWILDERPSESTGFNLW